MPVGSFWTEDEVTRLIELRSTGLGWSEIGRQLGRNHNAVRHKYSTLDLTNPVMRRSEPPPEAAEEMETLKQSATTTRIQELELELAGLRERAPVKAQWDDNELFDAAEEWRKSEDRNAKRIERADKQRYFDATFPDGPIAVSFISDQHISDDNTVDMRRMREDAELIRDTPGFYAVLGGDGIDNHILIRPAMLAARSQPADQYQKFEYYLQILSPKILVLTSGNHDHWTNTAAGVDMLSRIATDNKWCYCPHGAMINASVGKQQYRLAVRHRYRFNSSFNQTHSVKRWYDMGPEPFDVGCICHHHEHCIEQFVRHGELRWACRPGSYQYSSDYSRDRGWNDSIPTCPTFILYPDRRQIDGFGDLRAAVRAWEGISQNN